MVVLELVGEQLFSTMPGILYFRVPGMKQRTSKSSYHTSLYYVMIGHACAWRQHAWSGRAVLVNACKGVNAHNTKAREAGQGGEYLPTRTTRKRGGC